MTWARSLLVRALALGASLALVLIHRTERGTWFWVGAALVVLNVSGFLGMRSRAGRNERATPSSEPSGQLVDNQHDGDQSHCLAEFLSVPGVAAALAAGPPLWHQVSHFEDQFEPTTAEDLAAFVWIEDGGERAIGLDDEIKPYLDLDLAEVDDPVISVLESHPAIGAAFHEDRELYSIEAVSPMSTDEFAELVARALVAHHVRAASPA